MITRDEIDAMSLELGVHASNVQRDYMTGWVLTVLYGDSSLAEDLVLTGGNCFRKAYFPTTRFSNDIDFSTESAISEDSLKDGFMSICGVVQSATGVEFDMERTVVQPKRHVEEDRRAWDVRLYFTDFYGKPSSMAISLRLDVSEYVRIHLPIQTRNIIHPYSDRAACSATLRCLKLEELLANKLKCLLQRVHTVDLFDFVYSVFIAHDIDVNRVEVVQTFLEKTIFSRAPGMAQRHMRELPFGLLRDPWDRFLVCPKRAVLEFERAVSLFVDGVGDLFAEFSDAEGEHMFFPPELRNPILQAGRDCTLLELEYAGHRRVVEPYSLVFRRRKDGAAREYLYVWDRTGGSSGPGIKCMVHGRIGEVVNTDEPFEPRYPVELRKSGEPPSVTQFPRKKRSTFSTRRRRSASRTGSRRPGPIYVVQCSYCGRKFEHRTRSTKLRPHKDGYGNPCYGRRGYVVEHKYG